MKRFTLETIGCAIFVIGLIMVTGATFTGCEPKQTQTSENRLPVEENFHQEKIWTEDDFKKAQEEVDPSDIVYGVCDKLTGDCPPMITVDDVKLINAHHKARMEKLTAGVK